MTLACAAIFRWHLAVLNPFNSNTARLARQAIYDISKRCCTRGTRYHVGVTSPRGWFLEKLSANS